MRAMQAGPRRPSADCRQGFVCVVRSQVLSARPCRPSASGLSRSAHLWAFTLYPFASFPSSVPAVSGKSHSSHSYPGASLDLSEVDRGVGAAGTIPPWAGNRGSFRTDASGRSLCGGPGQTFLKPLAKAGSGATWRISSYTSMGLKIRTMPMTTKTMVSAAGPQ